MQTRAFGEAARGELLGLPDVAQSFTWYNDITELPVCLSTGQKVKQDFRALLPLVPCGPDTKKRGSPLFGSEVIGQTSG